MTHQIAERLVPAWLHESRLQGMLIVDPTLRVRFWNRWLAEASGKAAAAVIGEPLQALFPDLVQRGLLEAFTEALNGAERVLTQREHGYVFALPPPAGLHGFAHMQQRVRVGPVRDGDRIVGAVALIDDVTDRAAQDRAAEQALQAQQEALALLETLLHDAPIGIAFVDRELRFRHVNERMAAINRLPAAAHLGATYAELFPHTADLIMPLYQEVLRSGEPLINQEVSVFDAQTNTMAHYTVSHYPVRRADDAVIGLGSLVLETTDRKRTEAATHLLEQFGALISESLSTAETLQQAAQLALPTLGTCCIIELLGDQQPPQYFSASVGDTGVCRALLPLLQAAHGQPVLLSNIAQVGVRTVSDMPLEMLDAHGLQAVFALPLRARGRLLGAIACGSARAYTADDFTLAGELGRRLAQVVDTLQLHQAEQHARTSAERAVQVRDEFFSIAAHELRTPLTTLLGRVQLLERRMRRAAVADERDLRAVQTISDQAQRLNRMISALLNVSQIEMGQLQLERQPLSLRDLTRRIVEEHRLTLDKHTVAFVAPDDPVQIMGDELRLEQVLQNVLGNAAKYSPDGGQITVALTYTDTLARIAVIDRGIGIPASELPRLFRRFYRAEHGDQRRVGGMGIGLYVVKEIVERHGGRVRVSSTEGQGSTFTIELPLTAAPEAAATAPDGPA